MVGRCDDGVNFGLDPSTMWDESRKIEARKAGAVDLVLGVSDVPFDGKRIGFFGRTSEGEDGSRHGGD